MQPLYDPQAVRPMWEELAAVGVEPLHTPEEVQAAFDDTPGTLLVVVNSVCGCAAAGARPGVSLALQHDRIPDRRVTVFAGVDRAAVQEARAHMDAVPPSSPCIALFKGGKLAHILERRHIEQMDVRAIAQDLAQAFDAHCTRQGPSIPPEEFAKVVNVMQCSSTIPRFQG
jgi:putative YphP/YqiW family bacilliredoxin